MSVNAAPSNWWPLLKQAASVVWIDDASGQRPSLLFTDPRSEIVAWHHEQVPAALRALDQARADGYWVAGHLNYEALDGLDPSLAAVTTAENDRFDFGTPLLWFGLFRSAHVLAASSPTQTPEQFSFVPEAATGGGPSVGSHLQGVVSERCSEDFGRKNFGEREDFLRGLAIVRECLERGDVYQINLTSEARYRVSGSVADLYARLRQLQPAAHCAFVRRAGSELLSFSPELFFQIESADAANSSGPMIEARPVKGTSPRDTDGFLDDALREQLRGDRKNRAENVMIVDLLRNDLGVCCRFGTVVTQKLFEVETLPGLHQMVSTVRGELQTEFATRLFELTFPALFPCGSVTGAPKHSARSWIAKIEGRRRGAYTGSIGYAAPLGFRSEELPGGLPAVSFNVAIRTLEVGKQEARFGSGCGIVWDSIPEEEYAELNLKRSFLSGAFDDFALIETMLLSGGRFVLFLAHLRRLRRGLRAFAFPLNLQRRFLEECAALAHSFERPERGKLVGPHRVRVLAYADGRLDVQVSALQSGTGGVSETPQVAWTAQSLRLVLATETVFAGDMLRRHKTTERSIYDWQARLAREQGYDDALFCNHRGQLVETSIANVLVRLPEGWVTPTTACGALPGTFLDSLLARRRMPGHVPILARKIELREIARAKLVLVCNSVRGLQRVGTIVDSSGQIIYREPKSAKGKDTQLRAP